jgi:predicted RNA-binding Zn ribbon-like protein
MQFNTYTYAGAHIAAWLVNHPSPDASALAETLRRYDVHEPSVSAAQVRTLLAWTERLSTVFESGTVAEKAQRAGELLIAADCRPRLVSHGPDLPYHFHYAAVRTSLAARVKALTAAGLAHVIDDGAGARLRACSRAGCSTVFIDTSRNGRRHFCSVRCANQVNVANHRLRKRQAPAGSRRVVQTRPG